VVVTDDLPSYVTLGEFTEGPAGSYNGTQVIWNLGDLAEGTYRLSFTVLVDIGAPNGIYLNNAVQVEGMGFGPNTATLAQTVVAYPTHTPTNTDTPTATDTPTDTPTNTLTPTDTDTPTPTFTWTFTPSWTDTFTHTHTPTFTWTSCHTLTNTPTHSLTPVPTNTFTNTWTWTPTITPSSTWTPTSTQTPTFTPDIPCGLQVSLPYPNPVHDGQGVKFDLKSGCPVQARCVVYTTANRKVMDRTVDVSMLQTLAWDLTDLKGRRVANGVYYLRVEQVGGEVILKSAPLMVIR
jgi:hypothetical protein